MHKKVSAWVAYAKRDFEDAEALIEAKRYHGGLYFLQQSVEKTLKAYILHKGIKQLPFVHDIRYLLENAELIPPENLDLDIKALSLVYTRIRYPDMNTAYYSDSKVVKNLIQQFIELYTWILEQFKNK